MNTSYSHLQPPQWEVNAPRSRGKGVTLQATAAYNIVLRAAAAARARHSCTPLLPLRGQRGPLVYISFTHHLYGKVNNVSLVCTDLLNISNSIAAIMPSQPNSHYLLLFLRELPPTHGIEHFVWDHVDEQ